LLNQVATSAITAIITNDIANPDMVNLLLPYDFIVKLSRKLNAGDSAKKISKLTDCQMIEKTFSPHELKTKKHI
jgi:hypothetical protein